MVPDIMEDSGDISVVPAMHEILRLQDLLNTPTPPLAHSSQPARLSTHEPTSWPVIRATLSAAMPKSSYIAPSSYLPKSSTSHHHHQKHPQLNAVHHYVLENTPQVEQTPLRLGLSIPVLASGTKSAVSSSNMPSQPTVGQQQQKQDSAIASSAVSRAPQMQDRHTATSVRDPSEEDMIAMGTPIATFSDIPALAADPQATEPVMVLHIESSPATIASPIPPAATARASEPPATKLPASRLTGVSTVDYQVPLTFTVDYLPPRLGHATPVTLPGRITTRTPLISKMRPTEAESPTIVSATGVVPKTATTSNSHGPVNSGSSETTDLPLGFIALIVIGVLLLTGIALYFYFRRRGRRMSARTQQAAMVNSTVSHPILSDDDDDDDDELTFEEKLRRMRPGGVSRSTAGQPISKSFDRRSAGRVQLPTDSLFDSGDVSKGRKAAALAPHSRAASITSQRPGRAARQASANRDIVAVPRATRRQNTTIYTVHGLATVGTAVQGSSSSAHAGPLLETPGSAQDSTSGIPGPRGGIRKPKHGRGRAAARHSPIQPSLAASSKVDDLFERLKQRVGNIVSPRSQPAVVAPVVEKPATKPTHPSPASVPGSSESISDNYQFSKRHKPPLGPLRIVEPHLPSLSDELAVQRSDSVYVLGEFADGWVLAMNASQNNECGMIPRRCLFFSTAHFMTPSAIEASQPRQQRSQQDLCQSDKGRAKAPSTESQHRRRVSDGSCWKGGSKQDEEANGYFKEILHKL